MVQYPRIWDRHPFLSFGLPFILTILGGTQLLAHFLQAAYEEKDRREAGFGRLAEKRRSIPLANSIQSMAAYSPADDDYQMVQLPSPERPNE